ncbi:hypothetical protein Ahy_A03g010182 isoform A [Arachis hypogaea]|uniref:Uncharacterized protein n=1 Tax=Arachis hypogaea TaxID=3818 RepID=A0A445DLF4_ARAHY|nr:hypothetical protein Ahy_A03g010182 isoform A [Arachis hypogaea]
MYEIKFRLTFMLGHYIQMHLGRCFQLKGCRQGQLDGHDQFLVLRALVTFYPLKHSTSVAASVHLLWCCRCVKTNWERWVCLELQSIHFPLNTINWIQDLN